MYIDEAKSKEIAWLQQAVRLLKKCQLERPDTVTWAAYNAPLAEADTIKPALSQLMPIFYEKAAMVKHGMTVQQKAIKFMNPGQIPVTALAKLVRWRWPDSHGEDKYVVMLGGLHIEMAMWNTFGD